jgi:hypothetical protein
MEHYDKTKEQIGQSEEIYKKQLEEKDKAIIEMKALLNEKIEN